MSDHGHMDRALDYGLPGLTSELTEALAFTRAGNCWPFAAFAYRAGDPQLLEKLILTEGLPDRPWVRRFVADIVAGKLTRAKDDHNLERNARILLAVSFHIYFMDERRAGRSALYEGEGLDTIRAIYAYVGAAHNLTERGVAKVVEKNRRRIAEAATITPQP